MRVVIAEDHALLRDGLTRLLEAYDIEVVAAVDDAIALEEALRTHRPDIAVVDVRMPPTFTDEGLRAAIAARAFKIIEQVAEAERLDAVLAEAAWSSPRIDITDKILKLLDK